jgi:hypothetical protein
VRTVTRDDGGDTIYEVWQGRKLFWRRIVNNKSRAAAQWHTEYQKRQKIMARAAENEQRTA